MTSPEGFTAATKLEADNFEALQITGTAQSVAIAQALEAALHYGYSGGIDVSLQFPGYWRLRLTDQNGVDQFAYQGWWMVLRNGVLTFMDNDTFAASYSCNTPLIWDTSAPPQATATPGLGASIVVPAPTSANGPFTWTLHRNDHTNNTTADLTVTPLVENGVATINDSGLTAGDVYGWSVTLATQYQGVSATSEPSNTITAAE